MKKSSIFKYGLAAASVATGAIAFPIAGAVAGGIFAATTVATAIGATGLASGLAGLAVTGLTFAGIGLGAAAGKIAGKPISLPGRMFFGKKAFKFVKKVAKEIKQEIESNNNPFDKGSSDFGTGLSSGIIASASSQMRKANEKAYQAQLDKMEAAIAERATRIEAAAKNWKTPKTP
jgi:hypothetical protein